MRLSVCVAFHKRNRWLEEMLDSLVTCGYHFRDTEILLYDDGSDVTVPSPVDAYIAKYPNLIRVIRGEINRGIAVGRQKLVEEARGEYIMFFDSDDILAPFDIDGSMNWLDAHPDFCATYGKKFSFSEEEGFQGPWNGVTHSVFKLPFSPNETLSGMIVRCSDILATHGFRLPSGAEYRIGEDINFWIWLGARKNMRFMNETRSFSRKHPDSLSNADLGDYPKIYNRIRDEFIAAYPELYQKLSTGGNLTIRMDEKLPAVILCGVLFVRATAIEKQLNALNMARQLMPDDCGVKEYYVKTLSIAGRKAEALGWAMDLLNCGGVDDKPYIAGIAYDAAKDLFSEGSSLRETLEKRHKELLRGYACISQTQNEVVKKVLARMKNTSQPSQPK